MQDGNKKALSVKELAERWGVPVNAIYVKINDGSIPVLPLDGPKRILLSTIEEIEHESGADNQKGKTIKEIRLEKELKNNQEKFEELEVLLLDINKIITEIFIKIKL